MSEAIYKGFTHAHLEWAFHVRFPEREVIVPYFDANQHLHREKVFNRAGKPLAWSGEAKPQIPYGLETLRLGGSTIFLTEGESCAWALRASFPKCPVLGFPGASSWRPEWARLLEPYELIYLSFDNDEAGRSLVDAVWPFVPWARRVKQPEGRDTRDVLQLYGGIDAYERMLEDADYIAACTRYIFEVGGGLASSKEVA